MLLLVEMGWNMSILFKALLAVLLFTSTSWADFPPVNFREVDESPSTYPYRVIVTNDSLTDNADGTITLDLSGTGSGDNLSVDGSAVADPDFISTGDIDFIDTSNDITANINASVIDKDNFADQDWGDIYSSVGVVGISTGVVVVADLASADFGDWTCNGTSCSIDPTAITYTKGIFIEDPTASDHFTLYKAPAAITITAINCMCEPEGSGDTVDIQLQECDANGDSCVDVDANTDIQCANTSTADDGSLSNASIDVNDWVSLEINTVAGGATQLVVQWNYTIN